MELTAGGQTLAEVKIQWGIFLGNSHSPLLFVIAMTPLNYTLNAQEATNLLSHRKKINICIWMILRYLPRMKKNEKPWYK